MRVGLGLPKSLEFMLRVLCDLVYLSGGGLQIDTVIGVYLVLTTCVGLVLGSECQQCQIMCFTIVESIIVQTHIDQKTMAIAQFVYYSKVEVDSIPISA